MRAILDWVYRLLAFVILLAALWDDLRRDFFPAAAILAFLMFVVCAMTPNAWGTKPGTNERERD